MVGQVVTPVPAPFRDEIEALKSRLEARRQTSNSIVFLGSSSIRLWVSLAADFPEHDVTNCGVGGSTLRDWTFFGPELLTHLKPAAIVMYCGENDLARNEDPEVVFADFQRFYNMLRAAFPQIDLAYVSVKLSPIRVGLRGNIEKFNALVADFLRTRKPSRFIDVYHFLLGSDGQPNRALYTMDGLHLNSLGYAVLHREIDEFIRTRVAKSAVSNSR